MTFQERIAMLFGSLLKPSSRQLLEALKHLGARLEDVFPFLKEPHNKPYGRQMIYQNDHLEILLMQWSSSMDCSPHDHGQSMAGFRLFPAVLTILFTKFPLADFRGRN